jgi:uncharacterized protein YndB with AHSA1/START domain
MSATSLQLTVEVAAPVDQVWTVLTDFGAYAEWHPHITSARGELVAGGQIRVSAAGMAAMSVDATVVEIEIPHRLVFEAGDPDHLLVRHSWELTALPDGTTRVDDHESFLGPEAAAMFAQHSEAMRHQLEPIMDALKTAVESRPTKAAPYKTV